MLCLARNNASKYCEGEKRGDMMKNIYMAFIDYVKNYTVIDYTTKKLMYEKNVLLNTGTRTYTIQCFIYSVVFKNKETGVNYIMYYIMYRRSPFTHKILHNIVNIIPYENTLLDNGLDMHYVSASMFVYKMFDYDSQVDRTHTRDTTYTFIGDILDASDWIRTPTK